MTLSLQNDTSSDHKRENYKSTQSITDYAVWPSKRLYQIINKSY